MTLNDFANMQISNTGEGYIYVFDTEECMDSFVNRNNDYELLCTLHSSFVCSVYLKPEIANAKVMNFTAVGRNSVAVWITDADGTATAKRESDEVSSYV